MTTDGAIKKTREVIRLRHAYATHCLNRGANVKALQEALGHSQVEMTIGYCHAESCSVPSPLEVIT